MAYPLPPSALLCSYTPVSTAHPEREYTVRSKSAMARAGALTCYGLLSGPP